MAKSLVTKLQRVLLQHQSPPDEKIEDSTLAFISRYLLSDTEDDEAAPAGISASSSSSPLPSSGSKRTWQDYLDELNALIQSGRPENGEDDDRSRDLEQQPKNKKRPSHCKRELLHNVLMEAARAVISNDARKVYRLVDELSVFASPRGDCHERIAIYFIEALVARLGGYGAQMYKAHSEGMSSKSFLSLRLQSVPANRVMHVFPRETILQRCQGEKAVHIVDFGISHGLQWPSLMKALSEMENPPELRITGVDYPHRIDAMKTGTKLCEYAREYGIKLDYHGVSTTAWESVQPRCSPDEMLIVTCNLRLRHLKDDGTAANNPRKVFFENIHKLRPRMFTLCVLSANLNTPLFLPRFQEALRFYTAKLEYFESMMEESEYIEKVIRKDIVNVVACEGHEFVERLNAYEVWDTRLRQAGFQPLEPSDGVSEQVELVWGGNQHNENVVISRSKGWTLSGWKDVALYAMSAWTPAPCEFIC